MKKRIDQPAEDLFSEVVVDDDTTSAQQAGDGVQVDSLKLIEMGAFFDKSLAGGGGEDQPTIEICEPLIVEATDAELTEKATAKAASIVASGQYAADVDRLTRAAVDAFGILEKAFQDAAKAILRAMKDPAVQEAMKKVVETTEQVVPFEKYEIVRPQVDVASSESPEPQAATEVAASSEPSEDPPEPTSPKTKKPKQLLPSIVDDSPMWSIEIANTGILDGISRFGDQRKQSVIVACPTAGDLQRQIESPGLKKVEGIGGKIAEQIAANFESWKDANWTSVPTGPASDVVSSGQSPESTPDASLVASPNASESDAATQSKPAATQASGGGGEPGEAMSGDLGSLDGLTLLDDDVAADPQAVHCRTILAELVAKYRQHGADGYAVESQYQQYVDRGATDAESGVPGDDCIFTDDDRIFAWSWGWVVRTLGGEPVNEVS